MKFLKDFVDKLTVGRIVCLVITSPIWLTLGLACLIFFFIPVGIVQITYYGFTGEWSHSNNGRGPGR